MLIMLSIHHHLYLLVIGIFFVPLFHAKTDAPDVSALNVMYSSLNSPSQLTDWKSSKGDPCGDSWKGITCQGSSVTEITLSDLGLTGSMGYQLSSLTSVTYFDLSKNNLKGDIPYQLPPNAAHIDLAGNSFTGNVPYSISQMSDLKYLDLGHNQLNGQLSDMFGQLPKLTFLDLSFNTLSGNLPRSFGSLSHLDTLHLENNQFTGPINVLSNLPLEELNVENNKFTGSVPNKLKNIGNIQTGGNPWSSKSSDIDRKGGSSQGGGRSGPSGAAVAGIVIGVLAALAIVISLIACRSRPPPSSSNFLDEERPSPRRPFSSLEPYEFTKPPDLRELKSYDSSSSLGSKSFKSSRSTGLKPPPMGLVGSSSGNDFADRLHRRKSSSVRAIAYSLSDLQAATGNFAAGRLLAEGSIGRVYRAKYADGKVLAVKKIDSSHFQGRSLEEFVEIVSNISKLKHPNVAELVGYCSEQGHNMLVYEYFRNGSLHQFLHLSDDFSKPLTWNTRVKIALGAARGVEYLHEACFPPSIHKNIKSSNIFLDAELNPCLSECGLATFHQNTSDNLGVGYNPPECADLSAYTVKSDVYCFGVVMLELLSGRMPFDSSKPKIEQSLVRWAMPQLHDIDALEKMVDPALCGLYPSKALSRLADVIALCVQYEPEFRPPMSEVVQALVRVSSSFDYDHDRR